MADARIHGFTGDAEPGESVRSSQRPQFRFVWYLTRRRRKLNTARQETAISPIAEIVAEVRAGRMVVLVDEEDRENEGDLVMAAEFATPDAINFMARYGRGLICLTLTEERCRQLSLPLMVSNNRSPLGTNFTVSIEAAEGVTTGISAADRARTVQAAIRPDASPDDLVQPGHIFPLMAQTGRRSRARRTYRSRLRSRAACRAHARRRDLRDSEGRRRDGAAAGPRASSRRAIN